MEKITQTIANNLVAGRISMDNYSEVNMRNTGQQIIEFLSLLIPDCPPSEIAEAAENKVLEMNGNMISITYDFMNNQLRQDMPDIIEFDCEQLRTLGIAHSLGIVTDDNISLSTRMTSLEEIIAVSFDLYSMDEVLNIKEVVLDYKMPDSGGSYIPPRFLRYFDGPDLGNKPFDPDLSEIL